MNPLIQLKNATSVSLIAVACFALSPTAQAVSHPPDGGYPGQNTAEGDDALFNLTTGTDNTATGFQALFSNTSGNGNTAIGTGALEENTVGSRNTATGYVALVHNRSDRNTATGYRALVHNTNGHSNTATGNEALAFNTTGNSNTANGGGALLNNTTGSGNIALGAGAGSGLTTGDDNIDIGAQGFPGESNTIRIGKPGLQTTTVIAGISGVAVIGSQVLVSGNGKLGVTTSSNRFKEAIKPMDKASEAILALKPVTFHYKKEVDPEGTPQFGLVGEDVEKVNPDLVVRDADGKVFTVRYDAVNAMLLNEFRKVHRKVEEQGATIAKQQKQIEALTAGLQKVSDQLKLSKLAPQIALSNQ
jgi:hypothetical protein